MTQAAGKVTVQVDGRRLRSKPGATLQVGGIQRESQVTDQGAVFYTEKIVPAMIKCTMPFMTDTDIVRVREHRQVSLVYTTDIGVSFIVSNAHLTQVGDLTNGEVELTYMGDPAKQL